MKNWLEKFSRSRAGVIVESVVLMVLMVGLLKFRTKGEKEIWTLAGLGAMALLSFCAAYRYLRERLSDREAGYVGKILAAAEAGVLSLLLVLMEIAFVCLAV